MGCYGAAVSWTEGYAFIEPMLDLRSDPDRAQLLAAELMRELTPRHVLYGVKWSVVAEALPQDEVVVTAGDLTFLVHLTWARRAERAPWPMCERADSAADFENLIEYRY